jgi:IclR family transcriptional regulator, pca regulon regulatory protein
MPLRSRSLRRMIAESMLVLSGRCKNSAMLPRNEKHVTAMGQVLLDLDPQRLTGVLQQIRFDQLTENSVGNSIQLCKILEQVRKQGYSVVDEEMFFGLRAIPVPLRNRRGELVAAINACVNRRSMEVTHLQKTVLPALAEAAEKIRSLPLKAVIAGASPDPSCPAC